MLRVGMTGYIDPWTYTDTVALFPPPAETPKLHSCIIREIRGGRLLVELEDGRIGEIDIYRFTPMYLRNTPGRVN